MARYIGFFSTLFLLLAGNVYGQQNTFYNHYFFNPFLYNPSYVAHNGYTELYLNYRKQWAGFDGAPTTGTLNFHLPINHKMGVGFTGYQDAAGVLRTTTGLVSFGYQIYLGNTIVQHKIAFGLSAGITNSYIAMDKVTNGGVPDVAFSNNNTSSMDGQFGVHYQNSNLRVSFAIPRIFKTYVISEENFNQPGIDQISSTISSISYNFKLTPRLAFEPFVMYRTEKTFGSQYEALGVFRIDNIAWAGGSYRQDYGAAAFFGFNVKEKIKVGYAYEFATSQITGFGNGSHEVQIALRLGKKQFIRELLSEKTEPEVEKVVAAEPTPPVEEIKKPEEQAPIVQEPVVAEEKIEKVEEPVQQAVTPEETQPKEQPVVTETVPTPTEAIPADFEHKIESSADGGLTPGHYVVVGAFHSQINANEFTNTLKKFGYPAHISYYPVRKYHIVHMGNVSSLEEAKMLRDEYRRKSRYSFRDTWILTIE
jgi:type IX secretion system PorP/SprF family membrane protein